MITRRWRRKPQEAILDSEGKRHCAECGDFIDPKDYGGEGVKRKNAAFCGSHCRARYHGFSRTKAGRD